MTEPSLRYQTTLDGISPDSFHPGFFDGWWNAPDAGTHLRILAGSDAIVLALAADEGGGEQVVGFVTALTDGVLYGVVTLLEVVPQLQGRGIGRQLMERVTDLLGPLYRIDLVCADDVLAFYEKVGYFPGGPGSHAVMRIDRAYQPGRSADGGPAQPRAGTAHAVG